MVRERKKKVIMADEIHVRNDKSCSECRPGYPIPCECGGLVHGTKGCVVMNIQCDSCTNARPIVKADESGEK